MKKFKAQHSENEDHGIWSHHFMGNRETVETVSDFIFLGSKITADGDGSHDIKRRLLLGKKVMTKLLLLLLSRFSRVRLFATPWTAAFQAPLSMGFSKQEYWSGLPSPSLIYQSITYCFYTHAHTNKNCPYFKAPITIGF